MSWARLDDGWHDHPKTVAAGPEAAGVWAMCLTWAYKQRKKSAHPGVVPDDVVKRFGGRRSSQIIRRLHEVRYLDDHTEHGWPIHDFADYLPSYDSQRAAEAGRLGGKAKRNGSEPLSEPLAKPEQNPSEPLAKPEQNPSEPLAKPEQTDPSRAPLIASARRNPVPTTTSLRSVGADQPRRPKPNETDSQAIVGAWIDGATEHAGERPSGKLINAIGREAKQLLGEGRDPARLVEIARAAGAKGYADLSRELLKSSSAQPANPDAPWNA